MRIYHLVSGEGAIIFSNLVPKSHYYNLYRKCKSENELINIDGKNYRHGKIVDNDLYFYFLTDEKIKSSRLFKEFRYVYLETLKQFFNYRKDVIQQSTKQANRILHNIVSYNAHTLQAVYSLIPQDQFTRLKTKHLKEIQEVIVNKPEKAAITLLTILKNNNLMKAELSVFNKLYEENPDMIYLDHPIHKIVKLVINTYWFDFLKKEVHINITSCTKLVHIDYESFLASFVHIIENALKYTLPRTQFDIIFTIKNEFVILTLDMISLKMTQYDFDNIYEEGYSGELPKSLNKDGKGIGMYMVKRLLELSNIELTIKNNVNPSNAIVEKGISYENNQFIFTMPLVH